MMDLWSRVHHAGAPMSLDGVEAFDVSDVLRMFWESPKDEFPYSWAEIPNAAPPFQSYFMFGSMPSVCVAGGTKLTGHGGKQIGALFYCKKRESGGWIVNVVMVGGRNPVWQPFGLAFRVKSDGLIDVFENGNRFAVYGPRDMASEARKMGLSEQQVVESVSGVAYPFVLATSILHCKNVSARRVNVPTRLAAAQAKKGRPSYTYSVLDIAPLRRMLSTAEGTPIGGGSMMRALHVCRGHFKDYRDGQGLFGKHRDIYWWEQSIRGNTDAGVHVKDYRLGVN